MDVHTLETELKTYEAKLPELIPHAGKFVVIKNSEVLGIFDTYQDALKAAYEKFGLEPFFVRQIAAVSQVSYFSRDIPACRA
jgi:hypothetical protein